MEDKLLYEVRVTETEDGFRMEIKGDKERIKKMGFGPMAFGRMAGFGPRHFRKGRRRGWGHGPRGRRGWHHGPPSRWQGESQATDEPVENV